MATWGHSEAMVEGKSLIQALARDLPAVIDARDAIQEMMAAGSTKWQQTEWIGFYPEFWFERNLAVELDAGPGPSFGNMTFDLQLKYVWDLKAHATGRSSWAPLNDLEAVTGCIRQHSGVGFVVLSGPCEYDHDGAFKAWHDQLKGEPSAYRRRIAQRNARSRRRKTTFSPQHLIAFRFSTVDDLQRARDEGWMKGFQEGMRNSNDVARRAKIQVNLDRIPPWAIVAEARR
jgi:hypothetical protein